jgi:hypothetical protein
MQRSPLPSSCPTVAALLLGVLLLGVFLLGGARSVSAQALQGRVLDEQDDRAIATALVRLVDESGEQRAITAADSAGFYRIEVPEPGVYRLQAERLGYDGFETPLLETPNPDGTYPIDLLMRRSPIPIRGLEVTTDQVDMRLRSETGLNPRAYRWEPIRYDELQDHIAQAHDLTAVMRWGNRGIVVRQTTRGPCFEVRARTCLSVYLNGSILNPEIVDTVPLEMLHTIVVLAPFESIMYPAGAVLMYTDAWLR